MKRKTTIITCIVCLLPILFGVIVYDRLPAQIPIHWNLEGNIDGYAAKSIFVFLLPLLMTLMQLFCLFMTKRDPKYQNYSAKMLRVVVWIIPVITLVLVTITYAVIFGYNISINFIIPIVLGILFILLGNYLPKCRQNYTLGIKTPWTLDDEENWNKTNRLGGYIMVAGGLGIIILTFFDLAFYGLLVFVAVFLIVSMGYSYLMYKKK